MKAYAVTDVGRTRDTNQDYFYYSSEPVGNLPNLYLVADGMGGHKAGDLASRFTIENVVRLVESYKDYRDPVTILAKAINEVNGMLIEKSKTETYLKLQMSETADYISLRKTFCRLQEIILLLKKWFYAGR